MIAAQAPLGLVSVQERYLSMTAVNVLLMVVIVGSAVKHPGVFVASGPYVACSITGAFVL